MRSAKLLGKTQYTWRRQTWPVGRNSQILVTMTRAHKSRIAVHQSNSPLRRLFSPEHLILPTSCDYSNLSHSKFFLLIKSVLSNAHLAVDKINCADCNAKPAKCFWPTTCVCQARDPSQSLWRRRTVRRVYLASSAFVKLATVLANEGRVGDASSLACALQPAKWPRRARARATERLSARALRRAPTSPQSRRRCCCCCCCCCASAASFCTRRTFSGLQKIHQICTTLFVNF